MCHERCSIQDEVSTKNTLEFFCIFPSWFPSVFLLFGVFCFQKTITYGFRWVFYPKKKEKSNSGKFFMNRKKLMITNLMKWCVIHSLKSLKAWFYFQKNVRFAMVQKLLVVIYLFNSFFPPSLFLSFFFFLFFPLSIYLSISFFLSSSLFFLLFLSIFLYQSQHLLK